MAVKGLKDDNAEERRVVSGTNSKQLEPGINNNNNKSIFKAQNLAPRDYFKRMH